MRIIAIFIVLFGFYFTLRAEAAEYAVARTSAPVLNTPDFQGVFGGTSGEKLKTDHCGQVRDLEYIALPGTVFTILNKQRVGTADIYQVETDDYAAPPNARLYVDSRFLKLEHVAPAPRRPLLPTREEIISALKASLGSRYVWGGNALNGVPELAAWFYKGIGDDDKGRLTLAGLDCSGLLYRATGGWTPRNTAQLTAFGRSVEIAGKRAAEIAAMLQPLDLIVWRGHVLIVIDQQAVIESRLDCGNSGNGGVVMTPLSRRIAEVMRTRLPANAISSVNERRNVFVVRRWYTDSRMVSDEKFTTKKKTD